MGAENLETILYFKFFYGCYNTPHFCLYRHNHKMFSVEIIYVLKTVYFYQYIKPDKDQNEHWVLFVLSCCFRGFTFPFL